MSILLSPLIESEHKNSLKKKKKKFDLGDAKCDKIFVIGKVHFCFTYVHA